MTATLNAEAPALDDPFALDLRVVADVVPSSAQGACTNGTDDGCDPTCASACVTGGV